VVEDGEGVEAGEDGKRQPVRVLPPGGEPLDQADQVVAEVADPAAHEGERAGLAAVAGEGGAEGRERRARHPLDPALPLPFEAVRVEAEDLARRSAEEAVA
jgi:hypothetical protein